MSKPSREEREAWAQLDELYAELPSVPCKGLCSVVCGPIPLSNLEARRMQLVSHVKPRTDENGTCIYLRDSRCSVYSVRPLICRVWGAIRTLSCMHGCVPAHWVKETRFIELAKQVERLSGIEKMLHTTERGLVHYEGESFAGFQPPTRSEADMEEDAIRTMGLRALHGGRIQLALRDKK